MSKKIIIGSTIFLCVIIILAVINFSSKSEAGIASQSQLPENKTLNKKQSADKVQVFLFHATQRCSTCIAIGKLAGETVNERFQEELKSGKIEFREVNIDLPENKELARKFQASGSALFLNSINNGEDHIAQDIKVWQLTGNPTAFKNYLENKINTLFGKNYGFN